MDHRDLMVGSHYVYEREEAVVHPLHYRLVQQAFIDVCEFLVHRSVVQQYFLWDTTRRKPRRRVTDILAWIKGMVSLRSA